MKIKNKELFIKSVNALVKYYDAIHDFSDSIGKIFDCYPIYTADEEIFKQYVSLLLNNEKDSIERDLIYDFLFDRQLKIYIKDKELGSINIEIKNTEDLCGYLIYGVKYFLEH